MQQARFVLFHCHQDWAQNVTLKIIKRFEKMHVYPASDVHLSIQALTVHRSNARSHAACLEITRLGRHLLSVPGPVAQASSQDKPGRSRRMDSPHLFVQLTKPRHSHPAIFQSWTPSHQALSIRTTARKLVVQARFFGRGFC